MKISKVVSILALCSFALTNIVYADTLRVQPMFATGVKEKRGVTAASNMELQKVFRQKDVIEMLGKLDYLILQEVPDEKIRKEDLDVVKIQVIRLFMLTGPAPDLVGLLINSYRGDGSRFDDVIAKPPYHNLP